MIVISTLAGGFVAVVLVLVLNAREDASQLDSEGNPGLTASDVRVHQVVDEAAATRSADDCTRLATLAYLMQREHLGGISLAACQDDVFDADEGLLDEPVAILGVRQATETPSGTNAVAVVRHRAGSDWAGLTVRLRITADKLAAIEGFVEPERAALERAIRVTLIEGPPALPKDVADCAVESLAGAPDAQLAAALVDASPRSLYSPALVCDRRAVIDRAMTGVPARFPFLPPAAVACAAAEIETFGTVQLLQFVLLRDERPALFAALDCDRRGALTRYGAQLRSGPYAVPKRALACVMRRLNAKSTAELVLVLTTKGTGEIAAACGFKPPQG